MIHPQPVVVLAVRLRHPEKKKKKRNQTAKRNAWCESLRRQMLKMYAWDR